jgi:hypothetical protein
MPHRRGTIALLSLIPSSYIFYLTTPFKNGEQDESELELLQAISFKGRPTVESNLFPPSRMQCLKERGAVILENFFTEIELHNMQSVENELFVLNKKMKRNDIKPKHNTF